MTLIGPFSNSPASPCWPLSGTLSFTVCRFTCWCIYKLWLKSSHCLPPKNTASGKQTYEMLSKSSSTHFKPSFAPDITKEKIVQPKIPIIHCRIQNKPWWLVPHWYKWWHQEFIKLQRSVLKHTSSTSLHILHYSHLELFKGAQMMSLNNNDRICIQVSIFRSAWKLGWIITFSDSYLWSAAKGLILQKFRFTLIQIFTHNLTLNLLNMRRSKTRSLHGL